MIHPLFKLLATRPGLLVEHAGAYAELAASEAADVVTELQTRAAFGAAAVISAGVTLGLAGVAGLLAAAVPVSSMPAPGVLVGLPLVAAAVTGLCAWRARRSARPVWLPLVRQQWEADRQIFREIEQAS